MRQTVSKNPATAKPARRVLTFYSHDTLVGALCALAGAGRCFDGWDEERLAINPEPDSL